MPLDSPILKSKTMKKERTFSNLKVRDRSNNSRHTPRTPRQPPLPIITSQVIHDEDARADVIEEDTTHNQRKSLFSSSIMPQVPSTSLNNKCRVDTEQQDLDDVETP